MPREWIWQFGREMLLSGYFISQNLQGFGNLTGFLEDILFFLKKKYPTEKRKN